MSRVFQIGTSGTVGTAVAAAIRERGHDLLTADYAAGEIDITDTASIAAAWARVGAVDAVVCTVGVVPLKPLAEWTRADVDAAVAGKLSSQIDVVLQGMAYVRPRGSFTLISGIMSRMPWHGGIGATIVDGGIDAFVMGAAAELGQDRRINAISPTILAESVAALGYNALPGHKPVPAADVAGAYLRSIEGIETGKVFILGE
jgi:NAD(P)-dependent dehydrogenase (short-subunit alcohol dehydrogenase family)